MSKVAFLLADQFEDSEMKTPYDAVKEAGHQADIIGLKQGQEIKGKQGKASYTTDKAIADVNINDYDAVVIPGGSSRKICVWIPIYCSLLRTDKAGKPIASICHGPQILASADLLKGRTITSYPPLQDDMVNAGANWDEEVVVDRNLITSRTPKDEPAFVRELLKAL